MQTHISPQLGDTAAAKQADRILRNCVHCGFCNATCPTYQLLGDELDGPRGRIYQIKGLFEGEQPAASVQHHLDRCLSCLNCETTCPSGIEYGQLLDLGREFIEQAVPRPASQRLLRWSLRAVLPRRRLFGALLGLGQLVRPLLPAVLKARIPLRQRPGVIPDNDHPRRILLLDGCVQPALTPNTNAATIRVLDRLGIGVIRAAGCCGTVNQHLAAGEAARQQLRHNIDAWWPAIQGGIEAIVSTASGCGLMVKDYGHLLRDDPAYADKAERVATLTRDLSELLSAAELAPLTPPRRDPIAFHPPCTLQHGQRLGGRVEALLRESGWQLTAVDNAHLCCGSAGTYSVLQPDLAGQLREQKLNALQQHRPSLIATANVGCQTHLQSATQLPVLHWIELFDPHHDANSIDTQETPHHR